MWEGYDLGLDTLALDLMHADFDLVTSLLGRPLTIQATGTGGPGSAAEVILGHPTVIARCASSPLMPQPYGVRGGWHATFTGAVLEYAIRAGLTGQRPATLTEFTTGGERPIDLPTASPPCAAVIDHVLACLNGHADNLIEPRQRPPRAGTHPGRPPAP